MTTTTDSDLKELKELIIDLKIGQERLFGQITTLDEKISGLKTEIGFIRDDVKDLRNTYQTQIWALIITVMGAIIATVVKFGFFANSSG
ncbi:MAG: hypothetical protein ACKN9E_16005 [Microcystaceae cyanobacterium]